MNKFLIGILILILLAGFGTYMFFTPKKSSSSRTMPTPAIPTANQAISPPDTKTINDLQLGGNGYLDKKGNFTLLYPNDYALDTQDPQHIRIYKRGETQRPQSEMSDGALIVFESVNLDNEPLNTWVDTQIKTATADGTSQIINPKKEITLNSYPGFTYTLQGLGSSETIVLHKDTTSNTAVIITYSISDPQNKGYQKEVDAILSSFKLLK